MPTEKISVEPKGGGGAGRILNAIEKVRLQKQRPCVERIHRVLRQLDPDLSVADVSLELEKAANDGVILKVVTNNVCSYKLPSPSASSSSSSTAAGSRQKGASLPVLKVLPSREFLDAVVSSVNCLESCSVETLESQLRRKYALEATGDTSIRQELSNCCRKLVKVGRLRKDGQFFSPSSKGSLENADSVTEPTVWKNPIIHLEDCASGKAMSSTSLQPSTAREWLKKKTKQRGSDSINRYSFYSGDKDVVSGAQTPFYEQHLDDLGTFPSDDVRKSSLKEREGDTYATWGKSKSPVERTSPQKNSNGKSKGSSFYQPTDFSRASTGSRKLATCDSTTSHPGAAQVTSTLESQSSTLWRPSPEKTKVGDREKESDGGTDEKPKKRSRSLQLAFLYDSLSKFFTASGSKRGATQRSAQSSASGDATVCRMSQAGSMSLRTATVPKAGYVDRWRPEEEKREKFSRTSKSSEKSKSVPMKMKKAAKDLCLKQRHFQTKSTGLGGGGGGEVFASQLTNDDSRLFEIAQTTAQERLLVTRGGLLSDIESRHCRTRVILGKYELESTQQIPYLPEYSTLPRIYICEFCLKCFKTKLMLERHVGKCGTCSRPPGEEIYRDSAVSVFEVHGSKEPVYCRHLVLFGRLFLDHPGLYCRVSQAIYYVVTVGDRNGCHLVGFYSREKLGEHNLACFLVLPQHRGKGFGHFMVHLSYWLSSTDETPKYPRPPLTDAAKWIYHSVWKKAITECIELEDLTEITVRVVSCLTGIRDADVQTMLCELGLMCEEDPRQRVITLTPALREILQIKAEEKTRPIEFNPSAFLDSRLTRKLRGKPRAAKRNGGQQQGKINPVPAKRQRHSESVEAVDEKPELPSKSTSKWKALDDSSATVLPLKRKVGWPKGLKRGPRKEKVPSENETVEAKDASVDISGAESRLDFESLRYSGGSLELEDVGVSTSARSTRYRESSDSPFEADERRLDIGDDEELMSDREGSTISEMPQLDEKENALREDGNNDLQFGRSPSPPQLEQEIPSPYFCPVGYMRHGLDMGSKDAQSVLSDCLAGRSVAPSPCFSVDEPPPKSDKRMTDNESDSDISATYNDNNGQTDYKGQSSRQGSATPCSPLGVTGSNFAASRASSSVDSEDDNSLSSTGLSRSSSVDLPAFAKAESSPPESSGSVKQKLFPAESPNSNKGKLSSVHSPDSAGGKPSPLSSPDVNRDRMSPVVLSPKENSPAGSPMSVKDKASSPSSPRAKSLSALPSPEAFQEKSSEAKKIEEVATPSSMERSPPYGGIRSENELQTNPGEDDLPRDHSSVIDLPPSSVLCYSETAERKEESGRRAEQANSAESVVLRESILPPVQPLFQQSVPEQMVDDTRIASRLAKEVPNAFCGPFANQSPVPSTSSQLVQLPFAGHGSALSHSYVPNGHGAIMSLPMSHNSQLVNNAMSRYEVSEMGRLDVAVRQQQQQQPRHHHHPMPKVGPAPENNLESSPAVTSSMVRTFSEPVAPQSVLMEAMSPHSFQMQNGLPTRLAKSGSGAANSFAQCNDLSSILAPNSHGTRVSRQMLANTSAMAGGRAAAALSPGYMNSIPSPAAKVTPNNFGQSKSTMMTGRSNAGRQHSSQAAAVATAGNFGHQQMSKQILSNKYNKAMVSNVQLQQQNLSSCGLYGHPKSSPGAGVPPQGISNSSPSMNYSAVPNLSPNSGECASVSLHTLSGHNNRNLVNASPAPSCSGKQYARNLQHGTSRGFNAGGGGGSLSPSPKQPGAGAIYQLHQSQNPALSPHQIQTAAPYVHGAVQRHIGDQFSPAPDSFSRQQGYMFQATYLAKLQQLTNDLGPFQAHYAMALPTNMSPSPIDMTLPSHASPQRNMTPPSLPAQQRHGAKQQIHRGGGGAQHKGGASSSASAPAAPGFLPDVPTGDMLARYQLLSGYHVQQPMTCPSFIHQGSPPQIPMQVGVMNVGVHPGQPSPNFMPGVQGQPNSAVYAAYGYINGGLASQPFNMHLNDLMRR